MKRWLLVVWDVNGKTIYGQWFVTRRGARIQGLAISTPPLNTYEVLRKRRALRVKL